jgi:hypothetical protein
MDRPIVRILARVFGSNQDLSGAKQDPRQSRFGEIVNGMRQENKERPRFVSSPGDCRVTALPSSLQQRDDAHLGVAHVLIGKPVSTYPGDALVPFEILYGALVFLRRRARIESAEIAAPAGLRIFLARIETKLARRQLADHGDTRRTIVLTRQTGRRYLVPPIQ